jgi:hypothetical protein
MTVAFGCVGRLIGPRPAISRPGVEHMLDPDLGELLAGLCPGARAHLPRFSKPANGRLRPNEPPHNQTSGCRLPCTHARE